MRINLAYIFVYVGKKATSEIFWDFVTLVIYYNLKKRREFVKHTNAFWDRDNCYVMIGDVRCFGSR